MDQIGAKTKILWLKQEPWQFCKCPELIFELK
jgi:hypothetical protein